MRKYFEAMIAWGTVITAAGVLVAVIQVVLVGRQIKDAAEQTAIATRQVEVAVEQGKMIKSIIEGYYEQSRRMTAYQALADWTRAQPPNAARCVEAMSALDQSQFNAAVDRTDFALQQGLVDKVLRCFSDKDGDEIKALVVDGRMTRKGSSLLVERVRLALNADENVTRLVKYGIGDKEMINEGIENAVSTEDAKIIRMLDNKIGRSTFPPLLEFLKARSPATRPKTELGVEVRN